MAANLQFINKLVKTLEGLKPLTDENQRKLDKKMRLEFNYNTNNIEGNTLTYGETELLLYFDKTTGNHEHREYEEMKAHDVAFELINEWAGDKEHHLTEADIKNLHQILLVRPFWKEALTPDGQPTRRLIKVGNYKEQPNNVRLQNGEMFDFATPQDTPILMGELMQWYREEEEKNELPPIALASLLHYKFVRIHPFDDGNGRISRLLMNYVLLKHDLPPVIIKSVDKKNYLFALNLADIGNLEAFIEYIENELIWSLELIIKAAKGESIDEPGDLDKKLYSLKTKLGLQADKKVEIKYNQDAFYSLFENIIAPIIEAWEENLKELDTLFYSRNSNIKYSYIYYGEFVTPQKSYVLFDIAKIINDLYIDIGNKKIVIDEIGFQVVFQRLRNVNNNDNKSISGFLSFKLYDNVYEIIYSGSEKSISKLYSKTLDIVEIENITSTIGNFIFTEIENVIENNNN